MITFNLEEISKSIGIEIETQDEIIEYLESMRDYFRYHSKNLTKAQEMFIQGFINIVDGIEGR